MKGKWHDRKRWMRQVKKFFRMIRNWIKDPKFYLKQFFRQLFCKHEYDWYACYPGEHIYGCKKCGKVFDYYFNISEVI